MLDSQAHQWRATRTAAHTPATTAEVATYTARGEALQTIGIHEAELRKQVLDIEQDQASLRSLITSMKGHNLPESIGAFHYRKRVVSNDCANHLAAYTLGVGLAYGKLRTVSSVTRDRIASRCDFILGSEQRSALTTSDIPLPANYGKEIVQLVESYGIIRRLGTVYKLGRSTNKLPRLKTSPAFGFIDQSASVLEKVPQIEFVTFDAEKAGGLIIVPSEIDDDSFVNLGNFLADYCAREMAYLEDNTAFNGDGTSTFGNITGVLKYALSQSNNRTLGTGVCSPPEITLTDVRAMRWYVASAALINGAYFFNPTYEALFCQFNDMTDEGEVFVRSPQGDTLDNFPIHWVPALPAYDTADSADTLVGGFGDLSYGYLGVRREFSLNMSREVKFATDQIALRALEEIDFHNMDASSMSVLQLGPAA
ncbi:phage major capsid protein [bacterium]|nr:phage major capsid protein [bacterium]